MTVAEGCKGLHDYPVCRGLQWGRNLTVAEGRADVHVVELHQSRFNGAAT